MGKNIVKYISILIVVSITIGIFITVYSFAGKVQETTDIRDKAKQELIYLDKRLVSVINSLNNLDAESLIVNNEITIDKANGGSNEGENKDSSNETESKAEVTTINTKSILTRDKNDIDWKYINTTLEEVNSSWAIINLDLKSNGVKDESLSSFGSNMDMLLKYTSAQDKQNSLISLANLYSLIPDYESNLQNESRDVELKYLKSSVISSYALLDTDRWADIYLMINDAEMNMSKLMGITNNSIGMQKIELELKEYIKSINDKDINLCYMKYYYLIKDIENEE